MFAWRNEGVKDIRVVEFQGMRRISCSADGSERQSSTESGN